MSFRRIIALPFSQATLASAAKSRKSESRGSSAKKQKTVPGSVVPHRVFENQNLNEMGGSHAILYRTSGMIMPEYMSRIGDHWYAATKRSALGSILRSTVKAQNIDDYGEIYDKMQIVEPKAEDDIFAASCAQALMLPVTTGNALAQSSHVCLNEPLIWKWNSSKQWCSELKAGQGANHGERPPSVARTIQVKCL